VIGCWLNEQHSVPGRVTVPCCRHSVPSPRSWTCILP